ncbi:hypothetical protein K435DRAFT_859005 [Dendrothele bispora CBS 962.96]|uniref:Uncharacterized protein n=1 Tax=Dendrothele bispora (strain CBS 962.96) TaxID=1314807 RepID=A0A4V4HFR7_DENBC|nr:hypothetical protein K435DRAFT_859005 [Dendrothele bispora CBS 962.96]
MSLLLMTHETSQPLNCTVTRFTEEVKNYLSIPTCLSTRIKWSVFELQSGTAHDFDTATCCETHKLELLTGSQMSRFSEHSDSQSRNTRTIDELSQVQSMARSSPSTRFRLGRLHAAVQQADCNFDNNLDMTEAFDPIADILLGYTSFSDDTEAFHDMVAALNVLVERLPDTHPRKETLLRPCFTGAFAALSHLLED